MNDGGLNFPKNYKLRGTGGSGFEEVKFPVV